MTTLIAERPMTRRNDVPVKMDAEIVRKAKIVAAYRGQSLAEFLSVEMGPIVERLLMEEHAKETKGIRPARKRSKGGEGRD